MVWNTIFAFGAFGVCWGDPEFFIPDFTYRIGEHVQPPGQPPDGLRRISRAADPEDSTKPHLFFLHPHPCAVADVLICWCWCFCHRTQVAAHSSRALSMLPSRGANQIRTGRSGDNRLLTCLEAQEAGYSFVRNCSKCDYYLQNKALNMKAQTLPRSQLSKMWQCTDVHKFSNLYHSHCTNTPYKAISPKKVTPIFAVLGQASYHQPENERGCLIQHPQQWKIIQAHQLLLQMNLITVMFPPYFGI